jgi:hypothetical protein
MAAENYFWQAMGIKFLDMSRFLTIPHTAVIGIISVVFSKVDSVTTLKAFSLVLFLTFLFPSSEIPTSSLYYSRK